MGQLKKDTNQKIAGNKIILREIKRTDLLSCMKWLNDPQVNKFLSGNAKNPTEEQELRWFESIKKSKEDIIFSIISKQDNKYIGNCGLHKINQVEKTCELGIFIGDKNYWNRGLGTAATRLLLDFATGELGLKKIKLFVYEYNLKAKRVYEKCGFLTVGILKRHHLFDDRYWDTYVMEYNKNG